MADVIYRVTLSDAGYRAEASHPDGVIHIAEGLPSELDAQRWTDEYRRLVAKDERRQSRQE